MSSLCSRDQSLVQGIIGTYVSLTVGSLSILLVFSLALQELLSLMWSRLFILSFISLAVGDVLVKILLHGISENFLPMFSSRTFMVS